MARYQRILQISLVLLLLTFGLFKSKDCLADSFYYWENFDGYEEATDVGTEWPSPIKNFQRQVNATAYVATTTYVTYPHSLYYVPAGSNGNLYYLDFAENLSYFEFNVKKTSAGGDLSLTTQDWVNAKYNLLGFDSDNYLHCENGNVYYNSSGALNNTNWNKISIDFSSSTNVLVLVNDVNYATSSCELVAAPGGVAWEGAYNTSQYIDDFKNFRYDETAETIWNRPPWLDSGGNLVNGEISFLSPQYCTLGYSCWLWFDYSSQSVGANVYLLNYYDFLDILSVRELYDAKMRRDYFSLPTQTEATTTYYWVYYVSDGSTGSTSDAYYKLKVVWQQEPAFLEDFFSDYNCETICDTVASSTGIFDEFRYGVECGLRKVGCWALVPDDNALMNFAKATDNMKSNFPFSIFTQLYSIIDEDARAEYLGATSTALTLEPLLPGFSGVIVSTTMMSSAFGELWTMIYDVMTYMIYVAFFVYILRRILNITGAKKPEETTNV